MAHPHVHCIVPGGGLSPDGQDWISCREGFFLPVPVLGSLFRGKFLHALKKATDRRELLYPEEIDPDRDPFRYRDWLTSLYQQNWVVYSKPPFGGAEGGLQYLARYTHRTAISNQRLDSIRDDRVFFHYKDYRTRKRGITSLEATEFIRRLLLHILPDRFTRVRYYGLFANCHREKNLKRCRVLLDAPLEEPPTEAATETWQERLERLTGVDPRRCPDCGVGTLVVIETIRRPEHRTEPGTRAPP